MTSYIKLRPHPLELYEIFTTNKIRFYTGYIAGFTQKWMNMGTHLGEVIHSLALAPGESRNISIIEWYRRQSSNRDEKTIVDEQLSSSLVHSRALNEVVKTTAMEHLAGNSSMEASTKTTGFGLTAGGAATSSSGSSLSADLSKVVGFPLKAASSMLSSIAGSIGVSGVYSNNQQVGTLQSESSGTREVLGETQQNIKESTLQNSSNIRSIYSTIVVTDEQSEKETIQTKNVTNYNHSHALTIQYYEVLQRYEVLLQLESWTPVVYLPFKPVKFNISIILKYWHLLSVPVMASFSDFFERYNNFLKGYTPTNTNFILTQTVKVTKIKVTASSNGAPYLYKENQSGGVFGSNQQITKSINKPADHFQVLINQPAIASLPYLTFPINEMILSTPQLNFSDLGSLYLQWGHFPEIPQNPQDENTIKVDLEFTLLDANGDVTVITKSYSRTLKIQEFFNAHFTPIALTNNINSDLQNSFNSTAQSTSVELKNEVEKHFNTYKYAYTRYLLSSIEGDQLSDIIESLHFNSPGTIFIENYIFPNPIAITENYLVFKHKKLPPIPSDIENPCNPTEFEGFNDPFWDAFLRLRCNVEEYKNNKSNKTVDTVFLPTAGVFAEAILGRSNASEFVDPRRFWNWQDSPIPFSAPQIAAIQAGNHTVTDSSGVLTPNVPASNLNIINPPQYALPTTLSSALQAVQNGNMFRDMSKSGELVSILGNLSTLASTTATLAGNLSGEAASNALNGAVELGKQVAGMVNKAADTWAAQSVAPPPLTPTDKAAALNVLKDIPSDKSLSKVDEAIAGVVGSNISEKPPAEKAKSILDNPQISDNIQKSDNFEYSNGEEKIKTEKKNNSQDVTDDIDSANRKEINEFIKRLKNGSFPTFDPSAFDGNNFQDLNNIENKLFIPDIANHTHFMILSMAGSRERSFNRQLVRDILGLSTGLSTSTDLKFGYLALIDISKLLPSENGVYLLYDTGNGVEILESWGEQDINNHVIQIIYLTRALGALKNITHLSLGYWGHGNYLGFQADDSLILHVQINKILQRAYEVSNYTSKFDIIFIDSCSNGMIELAFQLRDFSQVFIGSQFYIPGFGIAYRLLATMMDLVEPSNPQDWSRLFIESYKRQYNSIDNSLGLCAVDLSKVSSEIIPIIKSIVDTILSDINTYIAEFKNIKSISTIVEDNGKYVGNDFFTIFDELNTKFPNTSLSISTSDVINKFRDALTSEPFIKLTKNNKSKVNGLSIFAPAKKTIFDKYSIYETLDFCQQTNWNLLLSQSF
jgi:Clostripain family